MKTVAALLIETGKPLEIEEIEIPSLKPGQVLVEIAYSGVCHTQILEARGYKGKDPFVPHCMGHEGTGVVLEITPGVTRVAKGDRVLMSWMKGGGLDVPGTQYKGSGGKTVNAGGVTTFSNHSVVSENRLTKIPAGMELIDGTMIGCAVATGMGSVINTAQVRSGQSVAVFGVGGIGLCAVAGAKVAGATTIIAIDLNPAKLEVARAMGATHVIDGSQDAPAAIQGIVKGGVDVAIEATGRPEVMKRSLESVRNQGGISVVIGNARHDELLSFDPKQLNMGKQLRGTWGGDNIPDRDFARYCAMLINKQFSLEPLSTSHYTLAEINKALDDLESGKTIRPIISLAGA